MEKTLVTSAKEGDIASVESLLGGGVDVNKCEHDYNSLARMLIYITARPCMQL